MDALVCDEYLINAFFAIHLKWMSKSGIISPITIEKQQS